MIIWAGMRTGSSALVNWAYNCDLNIKNLDRYDLKNTEDVPFKNLEVFNPSHGAYRNNRDLNQILSQDFVMKIHPELHTNKFMLDIIKNSNNHQHVILYREDPYSRLLSNHYAYINKEYHPSRKGSSTYRTDPIDVNSAIQYEILLRKKYKLIKKHTQVECISYESIYVQKDLKTLRRVFPGFNPNWIVSTPRYAVSKRYKEILNKEKLEAECLKLGRFKL